MLHLLREYSHANTCQDLKENQERHTSHFRVHHKVTKLKVTLKRRRFDDIRTEEPQQTALLHCCLLLHTLRSLGCDKQKKTTSEQKVPNVGKWRCYREGEQNLNINFLRHVEEVFVEGAVNGRLIFYMFRTIQCSK
jgi:hypothetical protein